MPMTKITSRILQKARYFILSQPWDPYVLNIAREYNLIILITVTDSDIVLEDQSVLFSWCQWQRLLLVYKRNARYFILSQPWDLNLLTLTMEETREYNLIILISSL